MKLAPLWTLVAPIAGWLLLGGTYLGWEGAYLILVALGLGACIVAGVYHAEVVAHRVGEPFGTLLLALAITVIEVALILTLMVAGGEAARSIARDTVFAAVMIILNGIVGLCLLAGGTRYGEQEFTQSGTTAALTTLTAIAVLTLILPNYTSTTPGPYYSSSQLGFIAIVSLVLYGTFVVVQTISHRSYFLQANEEPHGPAPSNRKAVASGILLVVALTAVVMNAKALAPSLERMVEAVGAPQAGVGVLIALLVMGPEGYAALRAARANRLQTSLNLALGSALASIGLTIPAVATVSVLLGKPLALGLAPKEEVLLALTVVVGVITLGTGRTTVLQGIVHLVIFAVYLFTTVVP
jgi:Ca2+:H+ antiporter